MSSRLLLLRRDNMERGQSEDVVFTSFRGMRRAHRVARRPVGCSLLEVGSKVEVQRSTDRDPSTDSAAADVREVAEFDTPAHTSNPVDACHIGKQDVPSQDGFATDA